jgi:hypothetical protein
MNGNSILQQARLGTFLGSLALVIAAFSPSVYAQQADSVSNKQSTVTAEKQLAQNEPSMGSPGEEEAELPVSTSNWQAFEDRMPIGFPNLYVTGEVRLPNPGYDAMLVRPLEQDYTDDSLTLVLVVNEPSRRFPIQPAVIDEETVRYEDEFYLGDYENVIIRAEDGSVLETIDIQVVQ